MSLPCLDCSAARLGLCVQCTVQDFDLSLSLARAGLDPLHASSWESVAIEVCEALLQSAPGPY